MVIHLLTLFDLERLIVHVFSYRYKRSLMQVASLKKSGEYDVLVIGGGATGVGESLRTGENHALIPS